VRQQWHKPNEFFVKSPSRHPPRAHAVLSFQVLFVSKRLGSPYVSGRSRHWLNMKNPHAPAVKRETEEDWGR
jgi:hypothetical protein